MTRKQFRKYKQERMRKEPDLELEKPTFTDPEEVEREFQKWRVEFLSQFPWYKENRNCV